MAEAPRGRLGPLMEEALARNPEILAARKRVEAARQKPAQASSLADPVLSVGYSSSGGPLPGQGLGAEPTSNIGFIVTQQIPAPGKRRLRGAIEARAADAVTQEYWMAQLSVAARLKAAWHRLHHAYEVIDLLDRNRTLLERILKVTEARYAVGKAAQQDLFKAQTQISLLALKRERFDQERRSREAEINALLVRPLDSPVPRPEDIEPRESMLTLEKLAAQAKAYAPVLQREINNVERAELALNLARKEGAVDFAVSGGYFNMGRMPDMYQARLDINLPFFTRSRQRAAVAEQTHTLDAARRAYQAAGNALLFRLKDDYLVSDASWRLMRMYSTTLIPQALLTLEASMSAYETGQVDFLTLLSNLSAVLEYEEGYHEEQMNYHLALIRLEEATGLELVEE
jgi:outer membrane protein TolC